LRLNLKIQLEAEIRSQYCPGMPLAFLALSVPVAGVSGAALLHPQDPAAELKRLAAEVESLAAELGALESRAPDGAASSPALVLGGYGELHANFTEGSGGDQLDFHRLVLYAGHTFAEGIQLHSEIELEHAAVIGGEDSGELVLEQLYVDWRVAPATAVRAGRMLVPVGIVNQRHEPPTFNGVERPLFEQFVVPSTWSIDGLGLAGSAAESVAWQIVLGAGLDGSGIDAVSGLRGARIDGSSSLNDPALTGRVDWRAAPGGDARVRVGASFYAGGLDNGSGGADPGLEDSSIALAALDLEASHGRFDLRAEWARARIDGADDILALTGESVGEEIDGWMVELGWHALPDSWKQDALAHSDAVIFARHEELDTQAELVDGGTADPAAERRATTLGLTWFFTPDLVAKADFQWRDDESGSGLAELANFGLGWSF
jgi:hypothetical protein